MSRYNKKRIKEYPYIGYFFNMTIDDNPMNPEEIKELVLATECDIQSGSSTQNGEFLSASYIVFFESDYHVRVGTMFESLVYGELINGVVLKSYKNQLGQTEVYLKDKTV